MSRLSTEGAHCPTTGAIVPLTPALGSEFATCDWCGRSHRLTHRWIGPESAWVSKTECGG